MGERLSRKEKTQVSKLISDRAWVNNGGINRNKDTLRQREKRQMLHAYKEEC
jgi:hypothetical protein